MSQRQKINALIAPLTAPQIGLLVSRAALRALPYTCTNDRDSKLDLWPEEGKRFEYLHHVFTALAATALAASVPVFPKNPQITLLRDELHNRVRAAATQRVKRLQNAGLGSPALATAEVALMCIIHALRAIRNERRVKCATDCLETEMSLGLSWDRLASEVAAIRSGFTSVLEAPVFAVDPRSQTAKALWASLSVSVLAAHPEFDHWIDWCTQRMDGKAVDPEDHKKRVFLPKEVKGKSALEINAYLRNLSAESYTLDRVRIIVLGWNASGKSTLVRALQGESVGPGSTVMTPGIDIHQWRPVPGILAHIWDFGGQVIAHATHQFFLRARCLYLVVIDGRADLTPEVQAEYWLQHIRSFGGDSPVMLVGNKTDALRVNMEEAEIARKYPNISSIHHVAATCYRTAHKAAFDTFRTDLIENIKTITENQVRFTREQHGVLNRLTEIAPKQPFIRDEDYAAICREFNVPEKGDLDRNWLLRLLDELGAVVHFESLNWAKPYILNPQWLTIGVYTLIYSDVLDESDGVITSDDVVSILSSKVVTDSAGNKLSYPPDMCHFIVEVMRHFKVCYELPNSPGTYIVPDRLPSDRPQFHFEKSDALQFRFNFTQLLPPHILPMLVVQCHNEVARDKVWQRGAYLTSLTYPDTHALVEVMPVERRVLLSVTGSHIGNYFPIIHNEISKLIALMPTLEVVHEIALAPAARQDRGGPKLRHLVGVEWTNFLAMLHNAKRGEYAVMGQSSTLYNAESVLRPIPEREREALSINIINAASVTVNANAPQQLVEELSESARALAREIDRILSRPVDLPEHGEGEAKAALRELKDSVIQVDGQPRREKKGTLEVINAAIEQLETNDSSLYRLLWKLHRSDDIITTLITRCSDVASLIARLLG